MCGAVQFSARNVPVKAAICHCDMCRRWTGSAFIAVDLPAEDVSWVGEAQIATLQSSEWAERAWCRRCGSTLYFRNTADDDHKVYEIALGLFDDPNGFEVKRELYIDQKPDAYAFKGAKHRKQITRAQYHAKNPTLAS